MTIAQGTLLDGRYEVGDELGRGAVGVVPEEAQVGLGIEGLLGAGGHDVALAVRCGAHLVARTFEHDPAERE